jgi:methanogenic corrinoid protein MtbC1
MFDEIVNAYNEAIYDTDRDQALKVVDDAIKQGISAEDIVFKVVTPAIEQMMKSIAENLDANLAQHFLTAQIASEVTEQMLPLFKQLPEQKGRIVIGTAFGDMHSLGRRIVSGCLKAKMIDVIDLGVNVSAEHFVNQALAHNAQVIGISAMMVHTARGEDGCIKVRQILKQRNLEDKIRIVVGGAPYRFDDELYQVVGADAWASDGVTASKIIADLVAEVKP